MGMSKELAELIDKAERQGWRHRFHKVHHVLYSPDGKTIVTVSHTSVSHRVIRNVKSQLRQGGFNG